MTKMNEFGAILSKIQKQGRERDQGSYKGEEKERGQGSYKGEKKRLLLIDQHSFLIDLVHPQLIKYHKPRKF